jgi:hypothetical protein
MRIGELPGNATTWSTDPVREVKPRAGLTSKVSARDPALGPIVDDYLASQRTHNSVFLPLDEHLRLRASRSERLLRCAPTSTSRCAKPARREATRRSRSGPRVANELPGSAAGCGTDPWRVVEDAGFNVDVHAATVLAELTLAPVAARADGTLPGIVTLPGARSRSSVRPSGLRDGGGSHSLRHHHHDARSADPQRQAAPLSAT